MKYKDDKTNNTVNGFHVGVRQGSPLRDALDPTNDGYDHIRGIVRNGTVLQDRADNTVNSISEE
jgi:hypothetical protein